MTSAQAAEILLALRTEPPRDGYQRLYVLAACVAASLLAAMILAATTFVPARRQPVRTRFVAPIAVIALVSVLLSLPAHLPFLLPHTVTLRADGEVLTQVDYSRAYRDAITYIWSSLLLLAVPVVASGRIDRRIKVAAAALAVLSVLGAYLPHYDHKGSRTENELIIFAVCLLTILYLGFRVQRTLERETDARAAAEESLQAAQAERARYEEQSQAAINEFRTIQRRLEARGERRTAFLASAAHDLRQPLAASVIYADLLAQAMKRAPGMPGDADTQRYLQVLKAEIASLATAFDAILDYSQIESGKLATRLQPHRLRDIFSDLERRFVPLAHERQLAIRFVTPPEACTVQTDKFC